MITAVLFDLDGTVAENIGKIFDAYKYALDKMSIQFNDDDLHNHMGKNISEIANILGITNMVSKLEKYYVEGLQQQEDNIILGMRCILDFLDSKNIPMGIVTSKLSVTTKILIKNLKIENYFSVYITSDNVKELKPSPVPMIKACEILGIPPSKNILYIGDSINDMLSAKNANISAIGVTWGLHADTICSYADICFSSVDSLFNYLLNNL